MNLWDFNRHHDKVFKPKIRYDFFKEIIKEYLVKDGEIGEKKHVFEMKALLIILKSNILKSFPEYSHIDFDIFKFAYMDYSTIDTDLAPIVPLSINNITITKLDLFFQSKKLLLG